MNPQHWQFEVGTERGKGRLTSYEVDDKPMLLGFDKNGKPQYHREFGLHFFTRRMKSIGYEKVAVKAKAAHA